MSPTSPLSPQQIRELRNRHPLYTRVAGEVVWALGEESGLDTEQCGILLDAFLACREATVALMAALDAGELDEVHLEAPPQCPHYGKLDGQCISRRQPQWPALLPTFAVGCQVACRPGSGATPQPEAGAGSSPLQIPSCPLLCPLVS